MNHSNNVRKSTEGETRKQSNVKLENEKDTMMKTKTLITTLALTGALLASVSVARANAVLTAASGSESSSVTGSTQSTLILSTSFSDGWIFSLSVAQAAFAPLDIDIAESGHGLTSAPLVITYTDGPFLESGSWTLNSSSSSTADLMVTVEALANGTPLTTQTVNTINNSINSGTLSGNLGTYEEIITITPTGTGPQSLSLDSHFMFTPTPDGGATLVLLGSLFAGIAGLRSKFGSKN